MIMVMTHEELLKFVEEEAGLNNEDEKALKPIDVKDKELRGGIISWINALESGEYNQAVGSLFKPFEDDRWGYCCLGVACYISGFDHDELIEKEEPEDLDQPSKNKLTEMLQNPSPFNKGNEVYNTKFQTILINLNDESAVDFNFIAKVLRAKYKIYD